MENEILEGNKLIAEFMGAKYYDCYKNSIYPNGISIWKYDTPPKEDCTILWNTPDMQYHTSWDWLMPVVEKIEKLPFIEERASDGHDKISLIYDINNVYPQVVEFIKWYNENTK